MSELTTIKCHKCKRIIMQVALVPGTHIVHRCHCNAWNVIRFEVAQNKT
jgi:hypothetical protein